MVTPSAVTSAIASKPYASQRAMSFPTLPLFSIRLTSASPRISSAARAAEEMRGEADVSLIEKSGKVGKLIARCEAYGFDAIAEVTADGVTMKELAK